MQFCSSVASGISLGASDTLLRGVSSCILGESFIVARSLQSREMFFDKFVSHVIAMWQSTADSTSLKIRVCRFSLLVFRPTHVKLLAMSYYTLSGYRVSALPSNSLALQVPYTLVSSVLTGLTVRLFMFSDMYFTNTYNQIKSLHAVAISVVWGGVAYAFSGSTEVALCATIITTFALSILLK
ncbi:MAG: hypothetical protein MRY21_06085 [Simkaniaceae bacterium]|nr:hypothetical protein [Simkaniaceae bacterium]